MKDALVVALIPVAVLGERPDRAAVRVEPGLLGCSPEPQAADILHLQYQLSSRFKPALCTTNLYVLCNLEIKMK